MIYGGNLHGDALEDLWQDESGRGGPAWVGDVSILETVKGGLGDPVGGADLGCIVRNAMGALSFGADGRKERLLYIIFIFSSLRIRLCVEIMLEKQPYGY